MAGPKVGTVQDGYRFKGGNPANPSNWQKLPPAKGTFESGYVFLGGNPADPKSWRKEEENLLEKVPLVGDAAAWLADIPLAAVSGLAGTLKAGADVAGAGSGVSRFLGDIAQGAEELKSSEARTDALISALEAEEAQKKGTWEEVKAAGRGFLRSPLETTASALGSAVPFLGAALAAPGAAGIATAAGLGAAVGAGTIKGAIYDATLKQAKQAGLSEEKALAMAEKAQEYGGDNLDQIALGTAIGAAASATGLPRQLSAVIAKRGAAEVLETVAKQTTTQAGRKSLLAGGAKGIVEETIPEAIQGGQERYAANLALQRQGYDVDPWEGVVGQAVSEGLASLVLGGIGGVKEAQAENLTNIREEIGKATIELPDNPTDDDKKAAMGRFTRWGINPDTASTIVDRIIGAKQAMAAQAEQEAQQRADIDQMLPPEAQIEEEQFLQPIPEPSARIAPERAPVTEEQPRQEIPPINLNVPEQVSRQDEDYFNALNTEALDALTRGGGVPSIAPSPLPVTEEPARTTAPVITPTQAVRILEDDAAVDGFAEQFGIDREEAVDRLTQATQTGIDYSPVEQKLTRAATPAAPVITPPQAVRILENDAVIDGFAQQLGVDRGELVSRLVETVETGIDYSPVAREPVSAAPPPAAAPEVPTTAPAPAAAPAITPTRANEILNDPVALSDYEAAGGDVDTLYESARIKYSRGRPPKVTADEGLFGALPTQEQNRLAKEEEIAQLKLATTPEERIAQQQEVGAAAQEQVAQLAEKDTANREEILGDIQYALRAQAPENAVYKVQYDPESKNPYTLVAETQLGKKPEVVLSAPTLEEFSDQVYGQMNELTPYVPAPELSAQTVEAAPETEPTVATDMIRQFTSEVDDALSAGKIDNNQRAELLARLERPNAYRTLPNGQVKPNDAIARTEAEANAAMQEFRAAENDAARDAAADKLQEINQRLTAAVQNGLLNPLRARMKSMTETRVDERFGAKQRAEGAKVQEALGRMEGADVTPEQREAREAKIEAKETKVQKYKRGQVTGIPASTVQRIVDGIVSKWKSKVPVSVVGSVKDLPPAMRAAVEADGALDAMGFVDTDGTVYLIASNLGSEEEVRATLFHEGLGHIGLEKLFRDKLHSTLTNLYNTNKNLREATNAWMKANPDAYKGKDRIARAVEEVLAERSENDIIPQSIMQRLVAFVRDFARRLGFDLDMSDADVTAILAQAHRRVVKGDAKSAVKGMRYIFGRRVGKNDRPKTTPKTKEELLRASGDVSTGLRRTMDSQNTESMAQGLGEAIRGHTDKPYINAMKENIDGIKPSILRKTLESLPTSGILDWFGKDLPALREVDKFVNEMTNMKANIIEAGDQIAKRIEAFVNKYGSAALAKAMHVARINEYAPDQFASMDEALKKHGAIQEVEGRALANSNNKKETRRLLDELKALVVEGKSREFVKEGSDKTKYTAQANKIVSQLEKLAIDSTEATRHAEQIVALTQRIRDVHAVWDVLGEQKGGHQLYKDIREFYKDMFEAELALLDERIAQVGDEDQVKRLRDVRADLMRQTLSPDEAKKQGDIFYDVKAEHFQKDYFPFMREGKYWLYIKGKPNVRERQFYTFETAKERNRAKMELARKLNLNPENQEDMSFGDDIAILQETFKNEDAMMQKVFDIVDKARQDANVYKNVEFDEIRDAIYQTWLMTTPERSMRRRFMHADEVTGYSSDVLNHFSRQVTAYANQLAKMAYAGRIRNEIKAAYDGVSKADVPNSLAAKWRNVIQEIDLRSEQEINPEPQSTFVNALNRMSFFYYLTAGATALIQPTVIPIRVVPRLWAQYGFAKGTAMWMKYMKVWNTLGVAKVEREPTSIGDQLHAAMPSVLGSSLLTKGKDAELLQRAAAAAKQRNLLQTVTDTLVQNEREAPQRQRSGVSGAVAKGMAEIGNIMGVMFNTSENISRQISFFMAFELAYEDFKKKNPDAAEEAVFEHALEQGTEMLRDTVGDFTSWERPRLAKGNFTRALFLFKMYAIIQTKFFVKNFNALVRGVGGDRAAAFKELTGVLMMAGMFGGLTGMPLYSLMAYALAESFDDEDDEDVKRLIQLDPRVAYDSDIMFRKWIMDKFGNPQEKDGSLLADMLVHGPISALTNTDLASRTSLDLKNMWFREVATGDTTEIAVIKTLLANIAGGQMIAQMLNAKDDFAEGNIAEGLKKALPAFFRTWVTGADQATKGIRDSKGNVIVPVEDISAVDTARALTGFRPMDVARWQDYYITRAKNEKKIEGKKRKILDSLERKIRDGDISTQAEFEEFIKDEIVPFNRTYPDPSLAITSETIERSLKGRAASRAQTVSGMQVEKKTSVRDVRMAQPFMPK